MLGQKMKMMWSIFKHCFWKISLVIQSYSFLFFIRRIKVEIHLSQVLFIKNKIYNFSFRTQKLELTRTIILHFVKK